MGLREFLLPQRVIDEEADRRIAARFRWWSANEEALRAAAAAGLDVGVDLIKPDSALLPQYKRGILAFARSIETQMARGKR